jgi:phytoene dehydrogenase-like protein
MKTAMVQRYDVVVIGAGLGGLTAAALLARAGRTVLVVERNASVGGAASTYKVKDLVVEAALHETSDPRAPGDPKQPILTRIGVLDAVEWVPTGALYEVRGGPIGEPLLLPDSFAGARDVLAERFPTARAGTDRLLAEMERAAAGSGCAGEPKGLSLLAALDRALGDCEPAKCALAANLALFHDNPGTIAWRFFAGAQGAYLASGSRFIKGGSQRLSNALRRVIQGGGGQFVFRRTATGIGLDADGAAAGLVHQRDGADPVEVRAPVIVGNAAPAALAALLPEPARQKFDQAFAARSLSTSVFSATVGLARPAAEFGLRAYSTVLLPPWLRRYADYARAADLLTGIADGDAPPLMIANYAAADCGLGGPPHPVCVLGLDRMENWQGLDRPAFETLRVRVLDGIIGRIDREFPGFAAAVVAKTLSTATSMSSYLNAPQGAIYGFAPLAGNAAAATPAAATPIRGLFLASAYSGWGGFNGAITGGAAAADAILADA